MSLASIFTSAAVAEPNIKALFEKPLIIGASVSADWSSQSPGKKLSLQYTTPPNIRTLAQGGRPGVETLKVVRESDMIDRSIILGIDLFFWDSTLPNAESSVAALDQLMRQVRKLDLPLVLGEIPELLPGRQPQRDRLNREITKACHSYSKCYLMPFDQLHKKVVKDGYLIMHGKKLTIREIVPDGLHLSQTAGNYLADVMLSLFK